MESKYNNWLISLDSDNFSLYIKTWFAFLASVHELVMKNASEDDQKQLMGAKGDKIFLKYYEDNILNKINIDNIRDVIFDIYNKSHEIIKADYPEYLFESYYKKVAKLEIADAKVVVIGKDEYKYTIRILDKNELNNIELYVGILVTSEGLKSSLKKQFMEAKISLIPDKSAFGIIQNEKIFYSNIRLELRKKYYSNIIKTDEKSTSKTLVIVDRLISDIINLLGGNDIHKYVFTPWCDKYRGSDDDNRKWFHYFCYMLRNIMFHRIIDPFDKRWSEVMKLGHQGLRELLLLNIDKLKSNTTKEDIVGWFLSNYMDPANGVPYNGREGGYQYWNGGPYNARNEIVEAFPDADEKIINSAVIEVEFESIEWVKRDEY
ncbi:hypothetical protein [Bacteroides sp.]|uniref:hypothetical protein n=1 Tax=Bacteroides sp. TaxID=29523 RepID=UPI002632D331|nr:hypothetical protein [Bacteroides sp.]